MNSKRFLKVMYILSALSLLLPWFTYNPDVMGYCRGITFIGWFLLPMVGLGICVFFRRSPALLLLGEVALIANLVILVAAFGRWQEVCNIQSGFRWSDGFKTAQIGYWTSLGLFVTMFSWFQIDLMIGMSKKQRKNRRVPDHI